MQASGRLFDLNALEGPEIFVWSRQHGEICYTSHAIRRAQVVRLGVE